MSARGHLAGVHTHTVARATADRAHTGHTVKDMRRRGFNNVELAVTLIVMGIIAGIAVPSYLTWRSAAAVSTAEQMLTSVTTAQLNFAQTWGGYSSYVGSYPSSPSDFERLPGGIMLTTGTATAPQEVSVAVGESGTAVLATTATNGACVIATMAPVVDGGDVTFSTSEQECNAAALLGADTPVDSSMSRTW